jgi:ribosomal protein S18 acetylase RimI-like enzyme
VWKARQAEAQARLWDDPRGYYFCNMVAVSPEAQGRGVGKRLFEVVTNRADQEGLRCYLESSKMVPNVEVYGRLGFGLCTEMECKENDGDEGCMVCFFSWASGDDDDDGLTGMVVVLYDARAKGEELIDD